MKIILERLVLINFKGIKSASIDFGHHTIISGANATGKTTIFDAFTWLLFGKDSQDRKDFDIKTLDENNNVIERIPHEVEGVLLVDNIKTLKLKRCYCEKWTRKRGSDVEEFTGHETKYFVNDVEKSQKDFNAEVSAICDEQLFKFITNPLFFPAQKKEVQRVMLFELAGDISDSDIINQHKEFVELFATMSGMDLAKFKAELAAKKRKAKEVLDTAPIQLEEVKRNLPELKDWTAIEKEIADKKKSIEAIDKQLADISISTKQQQEQRSKVQQQIGELKQSRLKREFSIKEEAFKEYNKQKENNSKEVSESEQLLRKMQTDKQNFEADIKVLEQRKAAFEKELKECRDEWSKENEKQIVFDDRDFTCPTCKRALDIEDIESKQDEMRSNFNKNKASMLQRLQSTGNNKKETIAGIEEQLVERREELEIVSKKLTDFVPVKPIALAEPETPDYTADKEHQQLSAKIVGLEESLSEQPSEVDFSEQSEGKKMLQESINELIKELALKSEIDKGNRRIEELETSIKTNAQELSELEKQEFTIAAFSKAKIEAVESRINGMFKCVKFKMYDTQINGGEVETCEAMVNGVPFSSLNKAMTINAGLDIINAICTNKNISAPIFIDNAEAVNQLLETNSQMVSLVVSEDKVLTIKA